MSSLLGPIGTLKGRGAPAAGGASASSGRPAGGPGLGDLGDDNEGAARGKRSAKGAKKGGAAAEGKKKPAAKQGAKPAGGAGGGGGAGARQPPRPGGMLGGGGLSSMLKDPMAIDFGDDDLSVSDMDADIEIEAPVGSEGSDAGCAAPPTVPPARQRRRPRVPSVTCDARAGRRRRRHRWARSAARAAARRRATRWQLRATCSGSSSSR